MMASIEAPPIARQFKDLPQTVRSEAERTAYLSDLAWHRGSSWDELLASRRILIIAEAGAGKTHECRMRQRALWDAGEPAFYLELADLPNQPLRDLLMPAQVARLEAWLTAQSEIATFFLDSVDELKLSLGSFERALRRLAREVAGHLHRVRIVITSRPIPIDEQLFRELLPIPDPAEGVPSAEHFAETVMRRGAVRADAPRPARDWRNVALLPLADEQIRQMAIGQLVEDPDALLEAVRRHGAQDFVRRPQDLIELCADWKLHHRIRAHRDQVASNIAIKLKPRSDRAERAPLAPEKAMDGARRLALAAILSRKLTLRHSVEADRDDPGAEAALDPALILAEWSQDETRTLLERALFSFASYGRVRFHHRSVVAYLAAEALARLLETGMPVRGLRRLLFVSTDQGEPAVKPSMRAVAAWLARDHAMVFEELLAREPETLLNEGDPETLSSAQRQRALRAFVERHRDGGWRGLGVPHIQLHRFASADLGPLVVELWHEGAENFEIRELLLTLIALGRLHDGADIAFAVALDASAGTGERLDAIDALIMLEDHRLAAVCASLAGQASDWPDRLARGALARLFPRYLSVVQLGNVLARVEEKPGALGEINWHFPRIVETTQLDPAALDALRETLTELVVDKLAWEPGSWPHLKTKRPFLLPALAAASVRQIRDRAITAGTLRSAAIVLQLNERDDEDDRPQQQLRRALRDLPGMSRQALFEAEDQFLEALRPEPNAFNRYARTAIHGALTLVEADLHWLREALAEQDRPLPTRAMLLEAAVRTRPQAVAWLDHLDALAPLVSDAPELVARLAELAQPSAGAGEYARWEREDAKRQARAKRRDAKAHASWVMFWREIVEAPQNVFAPDRADNSAWNLWRAMERDGNESRASGWSRRFIERHFGAQVADRLRIILMKLWRDDVPTLRSERAPAERNSYLTRWQLGLAGVAAETEDPDWARKLSPDEAAHALRYCSIELNGFPTWLEGLASAHPAAIDAVLGRELTAELGEAAAGHSSLLQDIRYAPGGVARLFLARLGTWLEEGSWRSADAGHDDAARVSRLRDVVGIFLAHGGPEQRKALEALAEAELAAGTSNALDGVWLPILMRLNPVAGVEALERILAPHRVSRFGPATGWFSSLFGDRNGDGDTYLAASGFTPELLLRLARLAYRYIRPADDLRRGGGSYSPNVRDHAERGRGNIVNALLAKGGTEGWRAKLELAGDPLFADFKDRALAMARELAAEEADSIAIQEAEIAALERYGELAPRTRQDMFALLADRLDDLDEELLRDVSPRAAWALIGEEKIMRQVIARELDRMRNHAYRVDQEAVTADEKETDIRLRSTASPEEAVIELKIGEKRRSAEELRVTLMAQLVTKYMAAPNCRSGCLLITVNSDRRWQHPETGESLDLDGLLAMLNQEASRIADDLGQSIHLIARGLDLRPRLPTERGNTSGARA